MYQVSAQLTSFHQQTYYRQEIATTTATALFVAIQLLQRAYPRNDFLGRLNLHSARVMTAVQYSRAALALVPIVAHLTFSPPQPTERPPVMRSLAPAIAYTLPLLLKLGARQYRSLILHDLCRGLDKGWYNWVHSIWHYVSPLFTLSEVTNIETAISSISRFLRAWQPPARAGEILPEASWTGLAASVLLLATYACQKPYTTPPIYPLVATQMTKLFPGQELF